MIDFGKYKGERWTRVPVSYLKWLINESTQYKDIAQAELSRRGSVVNFDLEISGHAIDRASLRCRAIWHETALNKEEGLHAWLYRMANEALATLPENSRNERIIYKGMKFCFKYGEIYPTLKTVMLL